MTEDGDRSLSTAEDGLHLLNERQAWQLLGLDTLLFRSKRGKAKFGWERLLTGLSCYAAVRGSGVFGESVTYPQELLREISQSDDARELMLKDYPVLRSLFFDQTHYNLASRPVDASFAQAAAFLDIASDWITCDNLYAFLSDSSRNRIWPQGLISRLVSAG
jgi:hypothetical protein